MAIGLRYYFHCSFLSRDVSQTRSHGNLLLHGHVELARRGSRWRGKVLNHVLLLVTSGKKDSVPIPSKYRTRLFIVKNMPGLFPGVFSCLLPSASRVITHDGVANACALRVYSTLLVGSRLGLQEQRRIECQEPPSPASASPFENGPANAQGAGKSWLLEDGVQRFPPAGTCRQTKKPVSLRSVSLFETRTRHPPCFFGC